MEGPDSTELHEKLRELIKENSKKVIIDLSDVDWMNSTGLGILISGLTTMRTAGGELKLAKAGPQVEQLLAPIVRSCLTGEQFIYKTVEEAVKSFSADSLAKKRS